MKYRVHIEYEIPMFAEVDIKANREDIARKIALDEFKEEHPEAIEEVIVKVEELG